MAAFLAILVHSLAPSSCQRVKDKDKDKDDPSSCQYLVEMHLPDHTCKINLDLDSCHRFWSVYNLTVFRSGLERWSGNSLGAIFFKVHIKWNPFQHNDIFDGSSAQGCKGSGRGTAKAVADSILQFPIHWGGPNLKATYIHPENQVGGFSPEETRVRERRK